MISRLAAAAALVAALTAPAVAAEYNLDLNHTQAEFSVVHLGFSHVRGLVPVTAGTLVLDGSNVPTTNVAPIWCAA